MRRGAWGMTRQAVAMMILGAKINPQEGARNHCGGGASCARKHGFAAPEMRMVNAPLSHGWRRGQPSMQGLWWTVWLAVVARSGWAERGLVAVIHVGVFCLANCLC